MIRCEVHDDPSHGFDDATADLDQLQAKRRDLCADFVALRHATAEFLVEDVRGRGHQHAQLVAESESNRIGRRRFRIGRWSDS
jgi:hypothetical protein